ncbi:hypothetical protein F3Y22_tig00116995pilonHSYRG00106 [Hibiscus syriacus]|uniref:Uncharacterized protein n=1 Tax=Hibiscus syriacus TaxID=106335 RepID=A0A6A2XG53_HIBSY|nr:hypothetical protein F3Y22_tig00116995pilonHSYRG00106 [Hibiscus syriacus]
MELVTSKSESSPGRTRSFTVKGDAIDMKCIKRRRRDHSNGALGCNNQQLQGDQPTATTVKRSSRFRGVSRHRWTGGSKLTYGISVVESNKEERKKGAYDEEDQQLEPMIWLQSSTGEHLLPPNFPISDYQNEVEIMRSVTKEEYLASLKGEAVGSQGEFPVQRSSEVHRSAHAYDIAAIEYRGINAIKLRQPRRLIRSANIELFPNRAKKLLTSFNSNALMAEPVDIRKKAVVSHCPHSSSAPSTALSLLLRSSMFNKLVEQNLNANHDEMKRTTQRKWPR